MLETDPRTTFYLARFVQRPTSNDVSEVKRLIQNSKTEIDEQFFPSDMTPLQIAIAEGSWDIFQLLINCGCSVNRADSRGCTPILLACSLKGRERFAQKLVNERANVNCSDFENGFTPLHWAVIGRNEDLLRLLLIGGADPSRPNRSHRTPLHLAVMSAWISGTELLLKSGSDSNYRDRDGFSPLYYASLILNDPRLRHSILTLMVACGADISLDAEYWATAKNSDDLFTGVDPQTLVWFDRAREQAAPLSLKWLCRNAVRNGLERAREDEGCAALVAGGWVPQGMREFLLMERH